MPVRRHITCCLLLWNTSHCPESPSPSFAERCKCTRMCFSLYVCNSLAIRQACTCTCTPTCSAVRSQITQHGFHCAGGTTTQPSLQLVLVHGVRQGTPVVHPTPTSTATEVRHCNPSYPSADRFHLCAHVPTLADQAMALDDALI